eukprot:scaffold2288_cov131-Skeletonema_menzelii.AAC.6
MVPGNATKLFNSASLWGSAGLRPNLRFPSMLFLGESKEHTINPSGQGVESVSNKDGCSVNHQELYEVTLTRRRCHDGVAATCRVKSRTERAIFRVS